MNMGGATRYTMATSARSYDHRRTWGDKWRILRRIMEIVRHSTSGARTTRRFMMH
jgi:hypothetical protein